MAPIPPRGTARGGDAKRRGGGVGGGSRDGVGAKKLAYISTQEKQSPAESVIETDSLEPCDNILELCSKNQDTPYGELALKPYANSLCDQALRRRVTLRLKSGRGQKEEPEAIASGLIFFMNRIE